MAGNTKISALATGNPAQAGDLIPIDRSGSNFSVSAGSLAFLTLVPTAGSPSPSPAYSLPEAPADESPAMYIQDVNGAWHQQAGIDITTTDVAGTGPPAPAGTLTFYRRTYFRDSQGTTQNFKNAFVSIAHQCGVGTATVGNQDRALAVQMANATGNIVSFSISGNVVTFGVTTSLGTATSFKKGMTVVPTGLSTGTYFNNQALTISNVVISSSTAMLVSAPFTHMDVTSTSDSGKLDMNLYSMACLQMEMDFNGTPVFVAAPDNEITTLSIQMADSHVGSISPALGCHTIQASYFREIGAGTSSLAGGIYVNVVNDSNVDLAFNRLHGILVSAGDNAAATNGFYSGVEILAPSPRFSGGNYGLYIGNWGSNAADRAIRVDGGAVVLGPGTTTMGNAIVSSMPTADPHAVGQLWNNLGIVNISAG